MYQFSCERKTCHISFGERDETRFWFRKKMDFACFLPPLPHSCNVLWNYQQSLLVHWQEGSHQTQTHQTHQKSNTDIELILDHQVLEYEPWQLPCGLPLPPAAHCIQTAGTLDCCHSYPEHSLRWLLRLTSLLPELPWQWPGKRNRTYVSSSGGRGYFCGLCASQISLQVPKWER